MPSTPRKGTKGYYVELSPELVEAFDQLANRTGRTRTLEMVRAMRRHLAYPEPELPPVGALPEEAAVLESPPGPATPQKRGRPRKTADSPTLQGEGDKAELQPTSEAEGRVSR